MVEQDSAWTKCSVGAFNKAGAQRECPSIAVCMAPLALPEVDSRSPLDLHVNVSFSSSSNHELLEGRHWVSPSAEPPAPAIVPYIWMHRNQADRTVSQDLGETAGDLRGCLQGFQNTLRRWGGGQGCCEH